MQWRCSVLGARTKPCSSCSRCVPLSCSDVCNSVWGSSRPLGCMKTTATYRASSLCYLRTWMPSKKSPWQPTVPSLGSWVAYLFINIHVICISIRMQH
jgi:hypothetical protein